MVDLPVLFDFLSQTEQRDEKRPATLLHLLLQHSTCLWHSSSPAVTSSPDLRSRKQHMTRTLAIFRKNAFHLFFMCILCTFFKKVNFPRMLLRGCATPPCVQQPVVSEQNLGSASAQKGVRIIKKGIKVQTLFFMFNFFCFLPCCIKPVPLSFYVVDNVVRHECLFLKWNGTTSGWIDFIDIAQVP